MMGSNVIYVFQSSIIIMQYYLSNKKSINMPLWIVQRQFNDPFNLSPVSCTVRDDD